MTASKHPTESEDGDGGDKKTAAEKNISHTRAAEKMSALHKLLRNVTQTNAVLNV